jgi:hypothetical protein
MSLPYAVIFLSKTQVTFCINDAGVKSPGLPLASRKNGEKRPMDCLLTGGSRNRAFLLAHRALLRHVRNGKHRMRNVYLGCNSCQKPDSLFFIFAGNVLFLIGFCISLVPK